MKEYEFVVRAIEEDFCDQLTALICYENYSVKAWEDGHKRPAIESQVENGEEPTCGENVGMDIKT